MAVIYEEIFKKRHYKRKLKHHYPGALTVFLLLAFLTSYLIWGLNLVSFYASSIAMIVTAIFMLYHRKDLLYSALLSGALMAVVSLAFYLPTEFFFPGWVEETYLFDNLSRVLVIGIPIEEFVFWFLAGMIFGPFYEYWQGERLRAMGSKK